MSNQTLRHVVLAALVGAIPLLPVTPAEAAAPVAQTVPQVSAARMAQILDTGPPVMQQALQYEDTAPLRYSAAAASAALRTDSTTNPRLYREVFGFAFASSLGDPTIGYPSWNMSLLTTVAYFSLHVDWNGQWSAGSALTTWNNPTGPVPGFIRAAHAAGTKVVLTVAMFDSRDGTPFMCNALQNGAVTIQNTVAEIKAKGIDGVNIDYESNNTMCAMPGGGTQSSQSLFTGFVRDMRAALPAGSYISVDTYSGAAGFRSGSVYQGFFDIGALNNYVDSFLVMAYDMEYSNWAAAPLYCPRFCIGPTAPLTTYLFNDTRASNEYTAVVPASKVIMGIPYYGRKECVGGYSPSTAPANAVGDTVAADGYLDASAENGYSANSDYHIHREPRDTQGSTRWDTFYSSQAGCTRELYWDDATALGNKYDLVINNHLRGIGIFALNYGGGAPELWNLINLKFGQCSRAAITADHTVPQIPGTSINFTGSAECAGTGQYRFWISPPSGGWTVTQNYSTSDTWTWAPAETSALGTYRIEVDARNLGSSSSYDTYAIMSFRLALCVTPTIATDQPSPQLPATTVTLSATVTCRGTPEFQYSMQAPGGTPTVVQPYGSSATYAWTAPAAAYGTYGFGVAVRTAGTTVASEATANASFARTSCIDTSLTADRASPQPTGSAITLTGSATCDGTPQYRFQVQAPGGAMTTLQDFGASSTFAWSANTAGGGYLLQVDARSAAAPVSSGWSAQMGYTLTSCSAGTLSVSPVSPQQPGTAVTLTAGASCPATPEYRFAVHNPDGTTTTLHDYGPASTYAWDTTGLAFGSYGLEVDVRDAGAITPFETNAKQSFAVSAAPCTTPALTPDVASPQGTGATITFTASTTTCPTPLYKFWVQTPDKTWHVMQDYSSSPKFAWTASGVAGTYQVEVDVRDITRPVSYDAYLYIPFTTTGCNAATLTADRTSPQTAGAMITLTGGATCPRVAQYRFYMKTAAGWSVVQDYGASNTFTWRPAAAGAYGLEVDVRDAGATASYESYASLSFSIEARCSSATLSAGPAGMAGTGSTVTLTATAAGCPTPNYRFLVAGKVVQPYSAAATYSWSTAGLPAGKYGLEVDVRNQSSTAGYEAYSVLGSYTLAPCSSARLSTDKTSPQPTGATVVLAGAASCLGVPEYRFLVDGRVVQGYGTASTFTLATAGLAVGTHALEVDVRGQGSAAGYEAWAKASLTLAGCSAARLTTDRASPQKTGTTVVLTATATCPGTPEYRFLVGGVVVQDYSTTNTFTWSSSGAGAVRLEVDVRNQGSTLGYEAWSAISFSLTA